MNDGTEQSNRFIVRLEGEKAYIYDAIIRDKTEIKRADSKAIAEYAKRRGVKPTEILHAIMKASSKIADYGTHKDLYLLVREFLVEHIDLIEDAEYDVLAAKVLESWLIDKFDTVGYIFFIGPSRSGKTRALETLATLCFNPKLAATMSAPAIYRILNEETATLFLDEIQQYLQEDKTIFMAVLNAGQRRGQKAIIVVKTGDGYKPQEFEGFGPKLMASTKPTTEALTTRCIIINMVKNIRQIPLKIDQEKAKKIRFKLAKFKEDWKDKEIPNVENLFLKAGFTDYRNIETFINLVAVTPSKYQKRILQYARNIDEQIAEEEGISFYAEFFQAILKALPTVKDGKLSVNAVAEAYNEGLSEDELLTNQKVGYHLNIIGLKDKCRWSNGTAARRINEKLMDRLKKRYRSTPSNKEKQQRQLQVPQERECLEIEGSEHFEGFMGCNENSLHKKIEKPLHIDRSSKCSKYSDSSSDREVKLLGDLLLVLQDSFRTVSAANKETFVSIIDENSGRGREFSERMFDYLISDGWFIPEGDDDWRFIG
jgi:hypothetical protein